MFIKNASGVQKASWTYVVYLQDISKKTFDERVRGRMKPEGLVSLASFQRRFPKKGTILILYASVQMKI